MQLTVPKSGITISCVVITHETHLAFLEAASLGHEEVVFKGIPTPPLPCCPEEDVKREMEACYDVLSNLDPIPSLLCVNMVSKFGIHLAELLHSHTRCVITSPSIPPPTSNSSRQIQSMAKTLLPTHLSNHLGAKWAIDLELWLLSLFLPVYQDFRRSHGLPSTLFHNPLKDVTLPIPVLFGISEWLLPKPGYWPDHIAFCG